MAIARWLDVGREGKLRGTQPFDEVSLTRKDIKKARKGMVASYAPCTTGKATDAKTIALERSALANANGPP